MTEDPMNRIPLPADTVSRILNTSAEATIVSDSAGFIRMSNQSADDLFGYDSGELVGKKVEVLIPEDQRERHLEFRKNYNDAPRGRPMVSGP